MASTLKASELGLEIVEQARRRKGWTKTCEAWRVSATVSKSTLDRFWMQKPIQYENFRAICEAVGVDWEQIVDLPAIEPTNITRKSNLAQSNQPVILELEEFGQQIFDWFGALDFKFEGLPRQEGKYVEWVIQVPVRRSRFDRVLIRATIHEAGLSDLDSLRRGVAQLRVDEGWLVTNLWVSQSVRQALNKSDDENLTCLTFDELIDQDANFTPYLDWLEREISKREIDRYYVDLGCTKGEFDPDTRTLRGTSKYSVADGGIDLYIDRWLENPMNEHVSILGEFGTGKTWFVLHYAGRCLRDYLEAKQKGLPRPRLPLVIPLRDYAKALNVENVLAGFFYTQHNIRLNSAVFDRLNRMGKLLLIFDGFDEMADKVDQQKMIVNFWELAKVVTPNAKVILTCRTEHFPTAQVGRDTLRGELLASTSMLTGVPPQFETLELMKFDDDQIREVLGRRTDEVTVGKVMGNGQVLDLLRRAVMGEFVLAALPEIEAGKEIDLARVYLYAVRRQMEENITTGRTFTSLADKLYFLCELSWEMLSTDRMSLNYREFPELLKRFFGREVESQKDLDHWHYDMMGQTMLVRNDDGDYSPAHRSLLEFFVAFKFAAELGMLTPDFLGMAKSQSGIAKDLEPQTYTWSNYWQKSVDNNGERISIPGLSKFESESSIKLSSTFGKKPLGKVILELHSHMLDKRIACQENNCLLELIRFTKRKTLVEVGFSGGNAATTLLRLNLNALENKDLSNCNLAYSNLVNAGLRGTDLNGANLSDCVTTRIFGSVNAIVICKNNPCFITAHDDNSIRIWHQENQIELYKLSGHIGHVHCLALSKDEKTLYSGSFDGTIKKWDIANGIYQKTIANHQVYVMSIALNKNEDLLYSGSSDGVIREWEIASGICRRMFEGHQNSVMSILLNKDGRILYSASHDGKIKEWRIADGKCLQTFEGHTDAVVSITLNKNEDLLYSGGYDKTIKEWITISGVCQRTFKGHEDLVGAITLSLDDNLLYSGSRDCRIKEWRINDGVCQRTFDGHEDRINALVVSTDGCFLYSGSHDRTIKTWKLLDGTCYYTFESYRDWIRAIALSPDGKVLFTGSHDWNVKMWTVFRSYLSKDF